MQSQLFGLSALHLLFRVRQGKPCKEMTWKNSRGTSLRAACRCAGREVGRGSGRKTKPGTSHGAQGQAGVPMGSVILDFNCLATPTPKFLMQTANRANKGKKCGRAGHFSLSHPHHRQGLSQGSWRLTNKYDQDMQPSRVNRELFNRHKAFRVPDTVPRASLCCCTVPGSHVPCLGDAWQGCHMEKPGASKPWDRGQGTSVMAQPGF